MKSSSVIQITTGVPGSGKSYGRVKYLVDQFIQDSTGKIITNLPLNIDRFVDYFEQLGYEESYIRERIVLIPMEVQKQWTEQTSGPWDYLNNEDLENAHVVIDEIHECVNKQSKPQHRKAWGDYLGTFRHLMATLELMTQGLSQVPREITDRCSIRLNYVPASDIRDPIVKASYSDWYQLFSKFFGRKFNKVFCYEKILIDGRWKDTHQETFRLDKFYFSFYDSYNATASMEEKKEVKSKQEEWQKYSWPKFIGWFLKRNAEGFIKPVLIVILFILFFAYKPHLYIVDMVVSNFKKETSQSHSQKTPELPESKDFDKKAAENLAVAKNIENERKVTINATEEYDKNIELKKKELELEKLKLEEKKRKEKEAQQKQLEQETRLVFISNEYAILRNRIKIRVGDKLNFKPFNNQKVIELDFENRRVCLDDKTYITFN